MPTYIALLRWTDQGARTAKQTVERSRQVEQMAQQGGGKMTAYWTLGEYDVVTVIEASDAETVAAMLLSVGTQGNVRSETLRAYSPEEMQRVLQKMP